MANELKTVTDNLARAERTSGPSGAVPNAPKRELRNIDDLVASNPSKHLRWCNINNPMIMTNHEAKGYTRLPKDRGGREVGGQAVFEISKEQYHRNVAAMQKRNEELLVVHDKNYEREAESIAKYLRDNHGITGISGESLTKV